MCFKERKKELWENFSNKNVRMGNENKKKKTGWTGKEDTLLRDKYSV